MSKSWLTHKRKILFLVKIQLENSEGRRAYDMKKEMGREWKLKVPKHRDKERND
jgi:hypothetical protein